MKSKYKPFNLLSLENLTWEEFYVNYNTTRNSVTGQNIDILKSKYDFLIDLILNRAISVQYFKINAVLLARVLGVEGKEYMDTLLKLGVIEIHKPSIPKKRSTMYKISDNNIIKIRFNYYNYKVEEYKKRNIELLMKYKSEIKQSKTEEL